ncbi:MAG TPA: hypothetical protein DDX98_13275 [Bacteroidales bacterium]|jgi:uncharacterized membrane protein YeiH|nr:hypothetical protein [Bacteroidales bacterium]
MEQVLEYISIAGAFAFAISGALTAMNKRFDAFGVFIIAFATAVGGGSLRDVFVNANAVFWLIHPEFMYFIIAGALFALVFRKYLGYLRKTLLLFDTLGLALYTVIGVEIGIQNQLSGISCVALGTITGAFGGVVRDILVNDVPLIFRKEIYATISILGGSIYFVLYNTQISSFYLHLIPIGVIIVLRLLVVYFKISFPAIYYESTD